MRRRTGLFAALTAALSLAPACALVLGAEELPEATDAGADAADARDDGADAGDAGDAWMPGACECPATTEWTKAFAAAGDVSVAGVAVDANDNVVIAGAISGDLTIDGQLLPGGPDHDVFVIALGPCGEHRWARRYGDTGEQRALGLAIDPPGSPHAGAIVITGVYGGTLDLGGAQGPLVATSSRAFVARLDPSTGDALARNDVGSSQDAASLAPTASGTTFWAGTAGAGLFVRELDESLFLTREIAPACTKCDVAVAVAPSGAAVAGGFRGSLDFAPGGPGALGPAGGSDIFAALLAPSTDAFTEGKMDKYGDPAPQFASALATDTAGNLYLAGAFAGTLNMGGGGKTRMTTGGLDAFVAKLADPGSPVWLSALGGGGLASDQQAFAIAQRGDLVAVAGDFVGALDLSADAGAPLMAVSGPSDGDAFAVVLDAANGSVRHAFAIGSSGLDHGAGVALDGTGHVLVAGVLAGPASLGCGTVGSDGASVFVAKRAVP
jgi:hypothetical protein